MTTAIAINGNHNTDIITFDDEKIGLIKRTIAKGATDDELALFMHQAQKTGLDPLARQIYFQKYNTKNGPQIAIITGIDGYRLVAVRTGLYAGNDAPEFEGRMKYAGVDVPVKASVTVYRIVGNRRCPFTASVYWDEYCPGAPKDYQWKKMPHVMLAKCAEAAALRKAFPADLSGVYTQEEMGQADWFEVEEPTVTKQLNGSKQEAQPDPVEDGHFEESPAVKQNGNGSKVPARKAAESALDDYVDEVQSELSLDDYINAAIASVNMKNFAQNIVAAGVGYDEVPHVVTALTSTYAEETGEAFVFPKSDVNKRRSLVNWLVDRKA